MNPIASGFITLCILLIAGSLAAGLTITAGFDLAEAAAIAMGALVIMITLHFHILRKRDSDMMISRYEDLTDQIESMLDELTNFRVRLEDTEDTVPDKAATAAVKRINAQLKPMLGEQEILGELVKQVAEAVAVLEGRLDRIEERSKHAASLGSPVAAAATPAERPAPPAQETERQQQPERPQHPGAAAVEVEKLQIAEAGNGSEPAAAQSRPQPPVQPEPADAPLTADDTVDDLAEFIEPDIEADPEPEPRLTAQDVRTHIRKNHLMLHLQSIMSLPERKVQFYEALARFVDGDETIEADEFLPVAVASGLVPAIDNLIVFRAAEVVRRLTERSPNIGMFCNLSPSSLVDPRFFEGLLTFLDDNQDLRDHLFLEFTQKDFETFGPIEDNNLAAILDVGFGFSVDQVTNLQADFRRYGQRGVRFVKISAATLLTALENKKADIHPADLAPLLKRYSIDLIVDRIETEEQNVELLDYSAKYGQGRLLAPPKPVRTDPAIAKRGIVDARRRAAQ